MASNLQSVTTLFQFYCSAIKTRWHCLFNKSIETFQFYCSAIKTPPESASKIAPPPFQFYCSAIKTLLHRTLAKLIFDHFNSTVVRLRQKIFLPHQTTVSDFNSTVVRLRPETMYWGIRPFVKFQFYCSAIKT